ncbi:NAD-dependent epimerase/dehydratase family protein [Roseiterribacter gracilis]|uniref:NAD-dependent epimerase n=1 Tax=Roseiterribacter gracilis TaxID=2812848 RepID=A0A8S8XL29_9PROT|nr:NAD-dependent epimerase [Rhodospirillales bacterium TMPK1]
MSRLFLVTGGAGFIGSHLTEALLARGDKVRILDDLSTGKRDNIPGNAELIVGDVADDRAVARAMAGADGCFHLAAIASVERGNRDWLGTNRANLVGTIAVLDAARRAKPNAAAKVVYASSAATYGDNDALPLSETAETRPLSAYGADKLASELHARVATVVHGVPTAGCRFFNVYGPRQDPKSPYSGVISIFFDRTLLNGKVTVLGDGLQTRDFVYVGDVVRALIAAMDRDGGKHPVFNVCTGRATSVLDLAHGIAKACGVPAVIEHGPARAGDVRASLGDPSRARDALGFEAVTTLDEGLAKTRASFA